MITKIRRHAWSAAPIALLGMAATACSTPAENNSEHDLHDFAALFEAYSTDYEPAATPGELAARSDLVIDGEVVSVTEGRVWGSAADDPGANTSVILNISVADALEGELPDGADGMVYVEVPSPGNVPASTYDDALPSGTEGVFYLVEASMSTTDILDPQAGRPSGQPLFEATTPQGVVLASQAVTLQLVETEDFDGTDLRAFIPKADRFPVGTDTTIEPEVPGQ